MKKCLYLVALVLVCAILFVGCGGNKKEADTSVDYSEYPFVNVSWTRDAEHDTETIRFSEDGGFVYYCGCGNPVNDSDLCEGYIYDDEMITVIKIVKCDEKELHLDFDGEVRIFAK